MIIQLRSSSGGGKSTLVRQILAEGNFTEVYREGRKRPLAYIDGNLVILGHYLCACGGCDTFKTNQEVYNLLIDYHNLGYNILFEGYILSAEVKNHYQLWKNGLPLEIIRLNTPIERCIANVNYRRQQKKPGAPTLDPKHTISKHKSVISAVKKLSLLGVPTQELSYKDAIRYIKDNFGV